MLSITSGTGQHNFDIDEKPTIRNYAAKNKQDTFCAYHEEKLIFIPLVVLDLRDSNMDFYKFFTELVLRADSVRELKCLSVCVSVCVKFILRPLIGPQVT